MVLVVDQRAYEVLTPRPCLKMSSSRSHGSNLTLRALVAKLDPKDAVAVVPLSDGYDPDFRCLARPIVSFRTPTMPWAGRRKRLDYRLPQ